MRASASLVAGVAAAAAAAAMVIAAGAGAPSGSPPSLVAEGADAAPQVLPDGLLYPDPDTGCIRPWREGDGDPVTAPDIWGPRSAPPDTSVQVQDPEPSPEPFGELRRGPWPICDEPPAGVPDSGS
jgi:hypothetical protein